MYIYIYMCGQGRRPDGPGDDAVGHAHRGRRQEAILYYYNILD